MGVFILSYLITHKKNCFYIKFLKFNLILKLKMADNDKCPKLNDCNKNLKTGTNGGSIINKDQDQNGHILDNGHNNELLNGHGSNYNGTLNGSNKNGSLNNNH